MGKSKALEEAALELAAEEQSIDADPNIPLNEAAARLIAMLPQSVREMLVETAVITLKLPLWQLCCGLIHQAYDLGLYTTPILDPDWLARMPVIPMEYRTHRCENEECGQPFQPKWPKQRYCSNECGAAVERRRLEHERLERERSDIRRPLGKEAPGAVSSAMRYDSEDSAGSSEPDRTAH